MLHGQLQDASWNTEGVPLQMYEQDPGGGGEGGLTRVCLPSLCAKENPCPCMRLSAA